MCKTKYCRNPTSSYCSTCRSRKSKKRDLFRYAYQTLKDNAKRRNIEFTISFEYFKKFCIKTNYIGKKGITAESYTVDRKKNHLGYIPGNLQILTLRDNVLKRHMSYDWQHKYARYY